MPISVSAGFAADAETNLKFSHSNDPASSRGRLADVGLRLNDDEDPIPPSREFQRPPPSAPPALNYAPGGPSVTTSLLAAAVPVGAGAGSATVVTVGSTMPVETAFIAAGAPSAPPVVVYANYSPGFAMPRDPRIDDSRSHVHWRSLFISAGLWASLIAMIVFLCTRSSSSSSSSSTYGSPSTITPELTASFVCVGIFTLIYLIEVCISDTRKFLSNRLSVGSAEDYVRRVYTTPPQPVFWIQVSQSGSSPCCWTVADRRPSALPAPCCSSPCILPSLYPRRCFTLAVVLPAVLPLRNARSHHHAPRFQGQHAHADAHDSCPRRHVQRAQAVRIRSVAGRV